MGRLRGFVLISLVVTIWYVAPGPAAAQTPQISFVNNCGFPVWLAQLPNAGDARVHPQPYKVLPSDNPDRAGKLTHGQTARYTIPADGWGGRFWPKVGCDADGNKCVAGSSVDGCPASGCQPPADTKVEFFYSPLSTTEQPNYDISLVDGYSLAMEITPSVLNAGGTCVATRCALSLDACPQAEIESLGDLRVTKGNQVVQCLAPCKRWNYTPPYGLGKPESTQPGLDMCCPTPPVDPGTCRAGRVVSTEYVKTVRAACPTAYSYSYDDVQGLHACPPGTSFTVTLCP